MMFQGIKNMLQSMVNLLLIIIARIVEHIIIGVPKYGIARKMTTVLM